MSTPPESREIAALRATWAQANLTAKAALGKLTKALLDAYPIKSGDLVRITEKGSKGRRNIGDRYRVEYVVIEPEWGASATPQLRARKVLPEGMGPIITLHSGDWERLE